MINENYKLTEKTLLVTYRSKFFLLVMIIEVYSW